MKKYDFRNNSMNNNNNSTITRRYSRCSNSSTLSSTINSSSDNESSNNRFNILSRVSSRQHKQKQVSATTKNMQRTNQQGMLYILAYFIKFLSIYSTTSIKNTKEE